MTNTETTFPRLSHLDKVRALVTVESEGFYEGPVTPAMQAGLDEGFLRVTEFEHCLRLTDTGRARLAGFRTLLGVD